MHKFSFMTTNILHKVTLINTPIKDHIIQEMKSTKRRDNHRQGGMHTQK